MPHDHATAWIDLNQRSLAAALAGVRAALERYAARPDGPAEPAGVQEATTSAPESTPSALTFLCRAFGLSAFERSVLLLCAGMELDGSFASVCAAAQRDPARPYPTWSLALAALSEAHWSALTPAGALRRWRLIEIVSQPARPLTTCPLQIDERVLHFLTGIQQPDERLAGLVAPVPPVADLVASHQSLARQVAAGWSQGQGQPPLIELHGGGEASRRNIAAAAAAQLGLQLHALSADMIPSGARELEELALLWEREAALTSSALYLDTEPVDSDESRTASTVSRLVERLSGAVVLGSRDRWRPLRRPSLRLEVKKPMRDEQQALWQSLLDGIANVNGHGQRLAQQFNLHEPAIRASVREALAIEPDAAALEERLWDAGRAQARPRLESLAQRIEAAAGWDELVLPEPEKRILHEVADQVAHRATVYDSWGFGKPGARGLGISALFCGPSGTGKTMAAEVMAAALRLDLYRIDLAGVVSKYIGETEKNLRRVFDAAEDGGAILFFDEADALFGKRTEVKDSHDRYANIEINYLLQRMEAYCGLAVLATNRKGDLDPAFLRRIRFVVNFPFPDAALRAQIWRRVFPAPAPVDELDWDKLSRLDLAGGNIRNIAVHAAFLAAAAAEPVRMRHVGQAACREFAKLERPMTDSVIGGWK